LDRQTIWIVSRKDDSHPRIVTDGYPTSVTDLFRVRGIYKTGHDGWNSCYSDVRTAIGLARLVEGEVSSMEDLEAAESALQILMWHDRVDVMIPGFKYRQGELVSYARCDVPRSELAFELFMPCQPYDVMYAVEEVEVRDRTIARSSLPDSRIVGLTWDEATRSYLETPAQRMAMSSMPIHMGVPAYLSDPLLQQFEGKRGFWGDFYSAIRKDWDQSASVVPDYSFSVKLPPLLSIVLDRASRRDGIPEAIRELREELEPARNEIDRLSEMLRGPFDQRDVENRCRDVKASFQAVVRASRKPDVTFVLPLLRLYSALKSPLDLLLKHLNPEYVPEDPRVLARRTVTGKIFAKLLATDSMQSLVSHYFSPAEVRSLEVSASKKAGPGATTDR